MEINDRAIAPSRLTYVPTEKVESNPNNPRGLFDPGPLEVLRSSIEEVGILVPLLIYERKIDGQYIILDGERRLICAKRLHLENIPANIIEEPTTIGNLLTMFNIHNVRESWELMPTALKLEFIMRELNTHSEVKISKLTGLTRSTVRRCKILLSYDKRYQDMMLIVDPQQRLKPDFFIELDTVLKLIQERLPNIYSKYPRPTLIEKFLNSYLSHRIRSVLDFREIASSIRSLESGYSKKEVESKLLRFLEDEETDIDIYVNDVKSVQQSESLKRSCELIINRISEFTYNAQYSDPDLREWLIKLRDIINKKLIQ